MGRAVIYMLDTHTCIYIINQRPPQVRAHFEGLHYGAVVVSSITGAELAFGVAKSGSPRNQDALEKFLAPLEVLPFRFGGDVRLRRATRPTPGKRTARWCPVDTLIAANALTVDATLVTNKLAEFDRVPRLACENWV